MKHAILIIAYHNFDYVVEQIRRYDEDFYVFIHWDKRNPLSVVQRKELERYAQVKYVGEEFVVNWGSYGIVRATMLLCEKSLDFLELDYFHLVSDADMLTVDLDVFKDFYRRNEGKNYMQFFPMLADDKEMDKVLYVHRLEKYDIRVNPADKAKYNEELELQKRKGMKKTLPDCRLYWGSAWWSLNRECVGLLVANEEFTERYYKEALFPDEMFAQTVIMNSHFADTVVCDNLRYISWGLRNGSNPAVLDRSDLVNILGNGYHFARKIDPVISKDLLDSIDTIVFQKYRAVDCYDMDLRQIVRVIVGNFEMSYKGLMYGNAGALVFLLLCFNLNRTKELVTSVVIKDLLKMVIEELKSVEDVSYSTGRLGLVCALEYIRGLYEVRYDEDTEDILRDINAKIVNRVYNDVEALPELDKEYYDAYFSALHKGGNIDSLSSYAWSYLHKYFVKGKGKDFLVSEKNVGLRGLSGMGLHILSEKHGLPEDDWMFLMP